MVLGAGQAEVVSLVVKHGLGAVALDIAVRWFAAADLTRFPRGLLFGVEPMDPYRFAMVVVVLLDVTALASYVLGRRKAQVESVTVLRYE